MEPQSAVPGEKCISSQHVSFKCSQRMSLKSYENLLEKASKREVILWVFQKERPGSSSPLDVASMWVRWIIFVFSLLTSLGPLLPRPQCIHALLTALYLWWLYFSSMISGMSRERSQLSPNSLKLRPF